MSDHTTDTSDTADGGTPCPCPCPPESPCPAPCPPECPCVEGEA